MVTFHLANTHYLVSVVKKISMRFMTEFVLWGLQKLNGVMPSTVARRHSLLGDNYISMVIECANLTEKLVETIFYRYPQYIIYEQMRNVLLSGDKKYEISDYAVRKIIENNLAIGIGEYL